MGKKKEGRIEFLEGFPKDVVAVAFKGYIDADEFENVLKPKVVERIKQEGKVKLFYVMDKDFDRVSSGFALGDVGFAARHMGDVVRIAIVTDKKSVRRAARFFSWLVAPEARVFKLKEMEAAKVWITENKPPMSGATEDEVEARKRMEMEFKNTILPIEQ